jgi:hypothetical protein
MALLPRACAPARRVAVDTVIAVKWKFFIGLCRAGMKACWRSGGGVKPAPTARRYAASGRDRSVRPSKLVHHAADASLSTSKTANPPSQKSLTQNFGHSP